MDVAIFDLWLPILLSTAVVFMISFVVWMVRPYHKRDWKGVGDEEQALAGLRGLAPGAYHFPHCDDMKETATDAYKERCRRGPVGILFMMKAEPCNMGPLLLRWALYLVYVGIIVAYVAGLAHRPGAHYMDVFQVAGAAAFIAYTTAAIPSGIWKGVPWSFVCKELFDGLIYALATAGIFASMWPAA